jgi:hypothetical protein
MRSIPKEIVELVINEPDKIIKEENNQHIFQKVVENYLYRVFTNNNKKPLLVKTVYRTSKFTKYV